MLKVCIKKKIDNFILDIDFEVNGNVLGMIGASGSGKSLTLKCIAGIEKPDEGYIELNGKTFFDSNKNINLRPQDRKVAYLFQNYALFPQMTVKKNILVSVNKKYEGTEREKKVREVMSLLHIEELEKKYPFELSGGEQQRVALARIIVNEPDFLLLDEPFSAIDAFLKWNLAKELKNVLKHIGKEVIFVTHNINEVYYLCNDVLVLSFGKVVEKSSVTELINNPKTEIAKNIVKYSDFSREELDEF